MLVTRIDPRIKIPGISAAWNRVEAEIPRTNPITMYAIEGGIRMPVQAPAATSARVGARIARFDQPRDCPAADRSGASGIRAGNCGEHAADQNGGGAEAALGPASQRLRYVEEFAAEAGAHQHIAGQDEQRHRGQREMVDPVEQALAEQ